MYTDDEMASLQHLASLAAQRSGLCAGALAAYQVQSGANDEELAARLTCTAEQLMRLRLCEIPQDHKDAVQIAAHLGMDAGPLAEFFHLPAQD
jgi:hypothetical protein